VDTLEGYSPVWPRRLGIRVFVIERIDVMAGCKLFTHLFRYMKKKRVGILAEALVCKSYVCVRFAGQHDGHLVDRVTDTIKITEDLGPFNG
jgi:hypothetical protein